jgi:uncharacterized protein (TIGR00106 family)
MIHAEISIYPIGTDSTSMSFYIAKSIDAIKELKIKYELTPMGTVLESENTDEIFAASKVIMETVHRLGVKRVETVLKIDSRDDKKQTMTDKIQSINEKL